MAVIIPSTQGDFITAPVETISINNTEKVEKEVLILLQAQKIAINRCNQ